MITGSQAAMAPEASNPSGPERWPSWKIHTMAPKLALMLIRLMSTALTGRKTEPKVRNSTPPARHGEQRLVVGDGHAGRRVQRGLHVGDAVELGEALHVSLQLRLALGVDAPPKIRCAPGHREVDGVALASGKVIGQREEAGAGGSVRQVGQVA